MHASIQIDQIGIGDLTLFAAWALNKKYTSISLCLSRHSLESYKANPYEYKQFALGYLQYLLPKVQIRDYELNERAPALPEVLTIANSNHRFGSFNLLFNQVNRSHFLDVFRSGCQKEENSNQVCIVTKARNLDIAKGLDTVHKVIECLNASNTSVLLMGERKVEFNKEYELYGHRRIYSIYDTVKSGLRPDLLIDMTVEKLGLSTPNLETLKSDLSVMSSSKRTLVFGCGGMFCTSILCGNLLSICEPEDANQVSSQIGSQVFCNQVDFLRILLEQLAH